MNRFLLTSLLAFTLGTAARAQGAALAPVAPVPIASREQLEASLRQALALLPEADTHPTAPQVLVDQVAANQPRAGDFLIALASDNSSPLQQRAVSAVVAAWQSMSAEQITTYLQSAIELKATLRPHYPTGFNVYGRFSYGTRFGWSSLPEGFKLKVHVTHLLDGQIYGKPYDYQGPQATTGWLQTGDLTEGEHIASLRLNFEFEHNEAAAKGEVESRPFKFSIVDAALPDDLKGLTTPEAVRALKSSFSVSDVEAGLSTPVGEGLHVPTWRLDQALPFALCFDVEIHEAQSGHIIKGDPIVIPAGETRSGYFAPYSPQQFTLGRAGSVEVQIVLQPSYERAMAEPTIQSFYASKLEFGNLHFQIDGAPVPPLR